MTKNKSKRINKRQIQKVSITHFVIFLVLIIFVYSLAKTIIKNHFLNKQGIETKALIVSKHKIGAKGIVRCYYEFHSYGNTYSGWVDDDTLNVGDSIRILYKNENPAINSAKEDL